MKNLLIIFFLLINQINLREPSNQDPPPQPPPPGPGPPPGPIDYNYSDYKAIKINENLAETDTVSSINPNESAVYVNESAEIIGAKIIKESGETSNIQLCEFFGVNAAILVQNGNLKMTGGEITTKVGGSNAIVATKNGNVTISNTKIHSTGDHSARGLHSTFGGNIKAKHVTISTEGDSCATLATDRGEGVVTCENCILSTKGAGSPLIYSTGNITVSETSGDSKGAQIVVIEGKNTANIEKNSKLKCSASPNREEIDQCGAMIYQSMSGDASIGDGTIICDNSDMEIYETSNYYKTAPMFFVTNTKAFIKLQNCNFIYGSNIFLSAKATTAWGQEGKNGGDVTLNINNQEINGDFIIDGLSSLKIYLINSTINGTINGDKTAKSLIINIDKVSTINLTGNSYYTEFINAKSDGSNLFNGSYSWNHYNPEKETDNPPNISTNIILNNILFILLLSIILY